MQAIILAAGKSTRTWPLTVNRPKALLKAGGKTVLCHNLEQLQGIVDEAVIIVGFGADQIKAEIGIKCCGIKIKYVDQKEQLGTGHALLQAAKYAKDRFIVLMGDDFYFRKDLEKCLKHKYCILGQEVDDLSKFGAITSKKGVLSGLFEKPVGAGAGLANTACYIFGKKIFSYMKNLQQSERGELELTDAILTFAKHYKVVVEKASSWLPIAYPWSLLDANEKLLESLQSDIKGEIEPHATVKGAVRIGHGSVVKNGAYIEGPVVIGENCTIGPNCFVRGSTTIGNDCKIGNAVEVKNVIFMDGCRVDHLSYVGDSVFGERVHLGAGTLIANLRHDKTNVQSMVKNQLVDTGRKKLGAILADDVQTGVNTSIYPGRKMWPGKWTHPAEVVRKDII
jgi:UDP-N-acetylglucosamine diphosphorylase / glucose-1-phosphate thymidylyltransferase / UDP-N-acetylgalactosamine diphosphorylase / glucosamine-1-phosphate N-acetyltransferase / galactosamine-1-phosphate N-acetyltransferase